jgi:tetratricopeptide (TPR) repeat protein
VKSAFRRIALKHHPDRSKDPNSATIFLRATEAYQVLSDPDRKREYDAFLAAKAAETEADRIRRIEEGVAKVKAAQAREREAERERSVPAVTLEEKNRLAGLFRKGRLAEAEEYARKLLRKDPRFGLAYGVLGDLARHRGDLKEAAKHYAYAVQFDPSNEHYQRRHEEALAAASPARATQTAPTPRWVVGTVGTLMVGGCAAYVAFSEERPILKDVDLLSTWTLGLIVMLLLSGLAAGACLAITGLLESFEALTNTSSGTLSPVISLGAVAFVNFWAAALVYVLIAVAQNAFSLTITRLMATAGALTVLMAFSSAVQESHDVFQVLVWGGNVVYFGVMAGWIVADSFRRA